MPRQTVMFRLQCLGTSESSPCFPLLREQRKSLGNLQVKELKEMGQKTNATEHPLCGEMPQDTP